MKKIMFSDKFLLTQAVLEGRKTQTRRLLTLTLHKKADRGNALIEVSPSKVFFEDGKWKFVYDDYVFLLPKESYPRYNVGEVVAVTQSYADCGNFPDCEYDEDGYPIMPTRSGFFNKMFVRADLMPHQILITDVRVEKLQDISDEDCLKEGLEWDGKAQKYYAGYVKGTEKKNWLGNTPREAFAHLINKVSRKDVWNENPYVFVYDFELVK